MDAPFPLEPTEQEQRIGKRLRELRIARNYSMNVAVLVRERSGVKIDSSYLSRLERGRAALPFRTLFALLGFYGVSPGDFFASVFTSDEDRARTLENLDRLTRMEADIQELRAQFEAVRSPEVQRRSG